MGNACTSDNAERNHNSTAWRFLYGPRLAAFGVAASTIFANLPSRNPHDMDRVADRVGRALFTFWDGAALVLGFSPSLIETPLCTLTSVASKFIRKLDDCLFYGPFQKIKSLQTFKSALDVTTSHEALNGVECAVVAAHTLKNRRLVSVSHGQPNAF